MYLFHILVFWELSHRYGHECRRNREINKRFPILGSTDMCLKARTNRDWLQSSMVLFSIDSCFSSLSFKCRGGIL
jgi:hypothetical protein